MQAEMTLANSQWATIVHQVNNGMCVRHEPNPVKYRGIPMGVV